MYCCATRESRICETIFHLKKGVKALFLLVWHRHPRLTLWLTGRESIPSHPAWQHGQFYSLTADGLDITRIQTRTPGFFMSGLFYIINIEKCQRHISLGHIPDPAVNLLMHKCFTGFQKEKNMHWWKNWLRFTLIIYKARRRFFGLLASQMQLRIYN